MSLNWVSSFSLSSFTSLSLSMSKFSRASLEVTILTFILPEKQKQKKRETLWIALLNTR